MKKFAWVLLCVAQCAFANLEEPASLEHLILVGSSAQVVKDPVEGSKPVVSQGVALLAENSSFLETLRADYIGKPLTKKTLNDIRERLLAFYQAEEQPFAVVTIPRQEFTNGTAQIVIQEAKLGEIRSKGNVYYTGTDLMSYIRTKPGHPILSKKIVEDLAWMNKNPFRRTDGVFSPGQRPGTVDLDLVTVDRWPYRVYAGADNTGTISTERERLFFGFNFGKTILKDADISYQFTCSPNWNRFWAHTGSTRVPCPWRHEFVFFGGYNQVEPELDVSNTKQTGTSWQVDGRYRIPIMDTPGILQTLVVGYDFKETSNRIKQNRRTTSHDVADINQFMIGYELGWKDSSRRLMLAAEVYGNPGGITDRNRSKFYEAFRFDGKSQYVYLKVAHSFAQKTPSGWWFSYDLTGQVSSANLLCSEQFTLTGYEAVRGFEERILLVDSAAVLKLTLETPHWSVAKYFGTKKAVDELYFLVFSDNAIGANHQRAQGERKLKTLGSIGPGMRYQWNRYITGRLDYGFQLWDKGFTNPSKSRYNFGLIISY